MLHKQEKARGLKLGLVHWRAQLYANTWQLTSQKPPVEERQPHNRYTNFTFLAPYFLSTLQMSYTSCAFARNHLLNG